MMTTVISKRKRTVTSGDPKFSATCRFGRVLYCVIPHNTAF